MIFASRFLRRESVFMTGPDVSVLQTSLKRAGFFSGPVDGIYNEATEQAVIAFQNARFLPVDGVVGPDTWMKLKIPAVLSLPYQPDFQSNLPVISIDVTKRRLTFSQNGDAPRSYKIGLEKSLPLPLWAIGQLCKKPPTLAVPLEQDGCG